MTWSGSLGKTAAGLGAVAVPVVFAVAGAGQASAESWFLRQWPLGVRIRMRQRARMGRLGTALGRRVAQRLGDGDDQGEDD